MPLRRTPSLARTHTVLALFTLFLAACGGSSEPTPVAATVEVTPTEVTREVGETVQLSAAVKDDEGTLLSRPVTWSTDASAVATVDNTGLVTGVGDGVATIRATADGKFGTSEVTVLGPCSTALAPVIAVGQTVNGTLATTDCLLIDGTYADGYGITVATTTTVQIDLTSSVFDTWLTLLELLQDGSLTVAEENDDIDPEVITDSRIVFTLNPGREYFILANSFEEAATGAYQLTVTATTAAARRVGGVMKPGKAPASVRLRAIRPR